jgi:hypothetical protein
MNKNFLPQNSSQIIELINKEISGIEHGILQISFHIRDSNISRITLNREQSILAKEFFTEI